MNWNKTVECVPNFSEGRDLKKIDRVVAPFRARTGVKLLDYSNDEDHSRLVVTLVGESEALRDTVIEVIGTAAELIDLNRHQGQHPCMGAVDVMPFIPIKNVMMDGAVSLSRKMREKVAGLYHLPVFLYERSATAPHRENLAVVRKGKFEGMTEKIKLPEWQPDFGPADRHPTVGTIAIGAHMPLAAYNINLNTDNLEIATKIVRNTRHINSGLRYIKAMGVELKERNTTQVSINVTDCIRTALYHVFELVRIEAHRYGVAIIGSEIVGLIPMETLINTASYYFGLENFSMQQVLESRIMGQRTMSENLIIFNAKVVTPLGFSAWKGKEVAELQILENVIVEVVDGTITYVGPNREKIRDGYYHYFWYYNARGKCLLSDLVDSHTHFVFGGERAEEPSWHLKEESYMSIMQRGGGITSTVEATRKLSFIYLRSRTEGLLRKMTSMGITTAEGKSGCGLNRETELLQLKVMRSLNNDERTRVGVAPTFLGTHALPSEYKDRPDNYIDFLIRELLPVIQRDLLAEFCDVFCEEGVFSVKQLRRLLTAARDYGLSPKLHANEIASLGGAELAAELSAVSADHLLHASDAGIEAMARRGVITTLPPLTAFALKEPYVRGRGIIDAGCAVALATDLNPGSCFSGSIPLTFALACIHIRFTVEKAITALTLNGAAAFNRADSIDSIEVGKKGDLVVLDSNNYNILPHYVGMNCVNTTIKDGVLYLSV